MSSPLRKHESPNRRLSGDGSAQARKHRGQSRAVTPIPFLCSLQFCCVQKICFEHMIKAEIFPPIKMYIAPTNLKT